MKKPGEYTTISIPIQLNQKIEELIKGTGFHSSSSFVVYVLRQILSEGRESKSLSQAGREVKKRLKNLGYL